MSRQVTLGELRTQSRLRADKVGSGFIKDDELLTYINSSYAELYDLLVGAYGNDYYLNSYEFSTNGTDRFFELPYDFYKLVGVDYINGGDTFLTLKPFQFNERAKYQLGTYWSAVVGIGGPRYKLSNNQIEFMPKPDGNYPIKIWYIPACPALIADSDELNGVNGFEEYIVVDAAIKMLQKEESDVTILMAQKMALIQRINTMAENRDAGMSFRVTDVNTDYFPGFDSDAYRY
jgi:hypothetical protein